MYNYNKELKRIGEICKKARKRHNIPIVYIVINSGYSRANVYHFENGENNNAIILNTYMSFMNDDEIRDIIVRGV